MCALRLQQGHCIALQKAHKRQTEHKAIIGCCRCNMLRQARPWQQQGHCSAQSITVAGTFQSKRQGASRHHATAVEHTCVTLCVRVRTGAGVQALSTVPEPSCPYLFQPQV